MNNLDSQLIRKYITLVENVNKSIENKDNVIKEPLDEQMSMFQDALKSLSNTIKAEPSLFQQLRTNSDIVRKYGLNNADDLANALKNNKIAPADAGKIVKDILKNPNTKELAIKIKGLISTEPGFIEIAKRIYPKGTQMPFDKAKMEIAKKTLAQLGITDAKVVDDMLKNAYQKSLNTTGNVVKKGAQKADDVAKAVKKSGDDVAKAGTQLSDDTVKIIDDGIKTTKETKNIYIFIKDYIKEIKVTIINNIKNYTIPKKLLYFLLISGGFALLYSLLKGNDQVIVIKDDDGNEIDKNKLPGWAQCMQNLVKSGKGELTKSSKGNPIVKVKTGTGRPEIDEKNGVLFFMDYTVLSMDGKIKGTWKCKGGQVQTIDEQSTGNITNDVSKMIDLLDFPVYESDLIQANKLLEKYVNNGQGKEFLQLYNDSGLADASLETSLKYIATYKPGSVQAKNQMYDKLRKIQSGKTGGGGTSTGDPLDGIEIIWGNKKKDDDKEKEKIKKDKYADCPNFPLYFGCKGPLVSELQTCLKMTGVDGKLGPNTKATAEAWGTKNNIELKENFPGGGGRFAVTEENFNKICGGKPVPEIITPTPNPNDPKPTPTPNPNDPKPTPTPKPEDPVIPTTDDTTKKLVQELIRNSHLEQRRENKWVYRGPDLTPEQEQLLIKYFKGAGFEPKSANNAVKDWRRGDKIVFKRTGSYDEE